MPNPFKPTAGATPPLLVGRQPILDAFQESIEDGPGSPYLLQLMTGFVTAGSAEGPGLQS